MITAMFVKHKQIKILPILLTEKRDAKENINSHSAVSIAVFPLSMPNFKKKRL